MISILLSICIGIGLSAATGFRVFIPMLIANIATMTGIIHPSESFSWLGTWPAFWVLATASVCEIVAYYIPFFDNILDTIMTPLTFVAGALLMTSFVYIQNPALHWALGIILGGGTAGAIQAGTSVTRLASSVTTAGIGNPLISTIENILSIIISIISIILPILALITVLFLCWFIVRILGKKTKPDSI